MRQVETKDDKEVANQGGMGTRGRASQACAKALRPPALGVRGRV